MMLTFQWLKMMLVQASSDSVISLNKTIYKSIFAALLEFFSLPLFLFWMLPASVVFS